MVQVGIPLWRVGVFIRTLHPDIFGRNFVWRPGAEVEVGTVDFNILDAPEFKASPLAIVFTQAKEVREPRLYDPAEPAAFRSSMTCAPKASRTISRCRCCLPMARSTPRAGPPSSRAASPTNNWRRCGHCTGAGAARRNHRVGAAPRRCCSTPMSATAGENHGRPDPPRPYRSRCCRDLAVRPARLYALSDRLPAETVVDILNHYFDCQVAAIRAHGGEVLKFMGDGLLAVFPIDEYVGDVEQVCSHVLSAAYESRAGVADMQFPIGDTVERFRFGVALHVGRILYGNIGGGNRLDFTCIGPAVNLAARLEKIAEPPPPHRRRLGRVRRHLPRRVERSRRVSDRGLFESRARLRADRTRRPVP